MNDQQLGRRTWVIAEGYIPGQSDSPDPELISHEAACILNPNAEPANVEIMVFFKDRDPAGPFRIPVAPQRTLHMRFNDLEEPERIPRDTPYSSVLRSDVPVVVQHTRLDARLPSHALLSTIAWSE